MIKTGLIQTVCLKQPVF